MVAEVEPEWLPVYAPKACTFSPPLEDPAPRYDRHADKVFCFMTSTFGEHITLIVVPAMLVIVQKEDCSFGLHNYFRDSLLFIIGILSPQRILFCLNLEALEGSFWCISFSFNGVKFDAYFLFWHAELDYQGCGL